MSFIKLDVEGAETALGPQLAADFPHPGDWLSRWKRAHLSARCPSLFEKAGFAMYTTCTTITTEYQRKPPVITPAEYSDFTSAGQADVLLSRQPLADI